MKSKYIIGLVLTSLTLSSCGDFLTRDPEDTATDIPSFWNNESNIRTSVIDLYGNYFVGYNTGWNRSDYFAETNVADWNDDNAQQVATMFTKVAPSTADGIDAENPTSPWDFTNVTTINKLIAHVQASNLSNEAKNHWLGVTRFFRALEYSRMVERFGDVPWYSTAPSSTDYDQLYKARDPRTTVMDSVLADLQYAAKNVRVDDGNKGLYVNRDVVEAFASRLLLFEGTWQKYRENNTTEAAKYLEAAKTFAEDVISSGRYSLNSDYKSLTTSLDLKGNPEMILYRSYVEGVVMHSLMSFQNTEHEKSSPSKSLIDSYLSANGLPIHQTDNKEWKGDKWFAEAISNRDPRLYANIDTTDLALNGVANVYAISGYFANRFVNESLKNLPGGLSSTNITDAPIMKLNEVLMNDIEACAELESLGKYTLTQADFDRTINVLRDRPSTHMPHLTLTGSNLSVNGTIINDPDRDQTVSPILWEIRRERRIELVYEGLRYNDLRRWGKLDYADMIKNPNVNLGAWVDKERYVAWYNSKHPGKEITVSTLNSVHLDREGNAGYIKPISDASLMRTVSDKDYLYPIPTNEITLYQQHGKTLTQNPGW